jgi:hypothetical protein
VNGERVRVSGTFCLPSLTYWQGSKLSLRRYDKDWEKDIVKTTNNMVETK